MIKDLCLKIHDLSNLNDSLHDKSQIRESSI